MFSLPIQDLVLIERCLQENAYDPDLAIVELLQLMTLSTDQLRKRVFTFKSDEYFCDNIVPPFQLSLERSRACNMAQRTAPVQTDSPSRRLCVVGNHQHSRQHSHR